MSEQTRKSPPPRQAEGDEHAGAGLKGKGEEINLKLDDLLDEIDDVLEDNAAEFVKSYVQRGGE